MAVLDKDTVCLLCSLKCAYRVAVENGVARGIEFLRSNRGNRGRLCARAHYSLDLLNSAERLFTPLLRSDIGLQEVTWAEAVRMAAARLRDVRERHGGEAVALVVGGDLTNDDVLAAEHFARHVLQTPHVALAVSPSDMGMLTSVHQVIPNIPALEQLDDVTCFLLVGDVLDRGPVLAERLLDTKYSGRGDRLIVIDPQKTRTTWFANLHLQCKPGTEALVLAGIVKARFEGAGRDCMRVQRNGLDSLLEGLSWERIEGESGVSRRHMALAAHGVGDAERLAIVLSPRFGVSGEAAGLVEMSNALVHAAKGGVGLLPLLTSGNGIGAYRALGRAKVLGLSGLVRQIAEGRIKAVLALGSDPLAACPAKDLIGVVCQLEFLAVSSPALNLTVRHADVVFPSAWWLEKEGTIGSWNGESTYLSPVLAPPGACRAEAETLALLARAMGVDGRSLGGGAIVASSSERGGNTSGKTRGWTEAVFDRLAAAEAPVAPNRGFTLVGSENAVHSGTGSVTRFSSWARRTLSAPYVEMSPQDASRLGVEHGRVRAVTDFGDMTLSVRVTDNVPPGLGSVPICFPETRGLFGPDGRPELATLEPAVEPAAVAGEKHG